MNEWMIGPFVQVAAIPFELQPIYHQCMPNQITQLRCDDNGIFAAATVLKSKRVLAKMFSFTTCWKSVKALLEYIYFDG